MKRWQKRQFEWMKRDFENGNMTEHQKDVFINHILNYAIKPSFYNKNKIEKVV